MNVFSNSLIRCRVATFRKTGSRKCFFSENRLSSSLRIYSSIKGDKKCESTVLNHKMPILLIINRLISVCYFEL